LISICKVKFHEARLRMKLNILWLNNAIERVFDKYRFNVLSLNLVEWIMYTNLLIISVLALAAGVLLAIDTIVLVSGISGIMFCLSIIIEGFGTGDLI
jgi:hypothetical protein